MLHYNLYQKCSCECLIDIAIVKLKFDSMACIICVLCMSFHLDKTGYSYVRKMAIAVLVFSSLSAVFTCVRVISGLYVCCVSSRMTFIMLSKSLNQAVILIKLHELYG